MMQSDYITIILGFIEGFALIISPCILPILPVFLAASFMGSKRQPIGMVFGFIFFFAVLLFFSRQLVHYLGINFEILRSVGYGILLFLGLVMISTYLSEKFSQLTQGLLRLGSVFSSLNKVQGGFFNGILLGGLISIIWTPCAGPILAAVIVQTVVQKNTLLGFFTLIAFALGAVIPLFIISLYGKRLIHTFGIFKKHTLFFRRSLGVIITASVFYMIYFEGVGGGSSSESRIGVKTSTSLINSLWRPYPEPQIDGIKAWINSPPLRLSDLKGKVVLIDFWTYSCINCLRTLPYLKYWYEHYREKGLMIIGIHAPEFDFERNLANVQAAVQENGILYPVALDNQFTTWINFKNHYWPAHYLINKKGDVVYEHFGEGDYDVTENNIRFLLGINELANLNTSKNELVAYTQTPETYLGYGRADSNLSPSLIRDKDFYYHYRAQLPFNAWDLNGLWSVGADSITAHASNSSLKIHFNAGKIFLVMGNSTNKPIKVRILLNNIEKKSILVDKYSIYEAISLPDHLSGYLEIKITEPGIRVYTLTFGG